MTTLARSLLPDEPDASVCGRLFRTTGGNPFLVRELLEAARAESDSDGLDGVDLEQLVPERIVQSVHRRVAAVGPHAERLCHAVAVFGEAALRDAVGLADLSEADAVAAADRLSAAGLMSAGPVLRFAHPILRQAVIARIPPAEASLAHARAARLLADAGAPSEQAAGHLLEALPRGDPWAAGVLLAAARSEERRGSPATAVPLLTRALAEPPPPDQRLEAMVSLARVQALSRHPDAVKTALPARPASVVLLANLAMLALERNEPPSRAAYLAELALSRGSLLGHGSFQLIYAVLTLIWTDRLEAAERACDQVAESAERSGSASLAVMAHALRSRLNLRRGRVPEAAADVEIYSAVALDHRPSQGTAFVRANAADVSLQRHQHAEAGRLLAEPHPEEHAGENPYYLQARGRYCLATGDPGAALANFLACGRALAARGGVDSPTMFAWRSHAARALIQLGDHQRARALAEEELALATVGGVPGAIGQALITLGLVEGGVNGLDRLSRALQVLAGSPRLLVRIHALIELGTMLRRAKQPKRAREELVIAGSRPRREASTGIAALTPSEQRVAQLVGRGHTNRQIADLLFVSPRTVATHLTHIYQKLGIESREQLCVLLASG